MVIVPLPRPAGSIPGFGFFKNRYHVVAVDGSSGTIIEDLFTVTGTVVVSLWGEIVTALGNHTNAHLRLYDGTASVDLSVNSGLTLSSKAAGTILVKTGPAASALGVVDVSAGDILESATAGQSIIHPVIVSKKTGATTTIQYVYDTTDAPTIGSIRWFASFQALSSDGELS